jgi:histidyl-tRNA synthetase
MERLLIACEELNISLTDPTKLDVYVVSLGNAARQWALGCLPTLRAHGLSASMDYSGRSMKAQMKEANRELARFTLIAGEQELQDEQFVLRDMEQSTETKGSLDELVTLLTKPLS